MELKKDNQQFKDRLNLSDQFPLVVTNGIIKDEEDALCTSDMNRFTKFTHFGKFSPPLQQLSSFIPTFAPKTLLAVTSQECALALLSLRVHSGLPLQQDGF